MMELLQGPDVTKYRRRLPLLASHWPLLAPAAKYRHISIGRHLV